MFARTRTEKKDKDKDKDKERREKRANVPGLFVKSGESEVFALCLSEGTFFFFLVERTGSSVSVVSETNVTKRERKIQLTD